MNDDKTRRLRQLELRRERNGLSGWLDGERVAVFWPSERGGVWAWSCQGDGYGEAATLALASADALRASLGLPADTSPRSDEALDWAVATRVCVSLSARADGAPGVTCVVSDPGGVAWVSHGADEDDAFARATQLYSKRPRA